ncbi:MAG TPA: hypothetical protein VFG53_21125 [Anaeromyxobacter sp.]|nr:hypothetical protein [Anaeromyxobacter sp.]
MSPTRIALLCAPIALFGLAVAIHATVRVHEGERQLTELAAAGRAAGESFVETLKGEQAERQWLAYDERRAVALSLAVARRDRLLGILAAGSAVLAAASLRALSRIAAEVEEDRRHVAGDGAAGGGPLEP